MCRKHTANVPGYPGSFRKLSAPRSTEEAVFATASSPNAKREDGDIVNLPTCGLKDGGSGQAAGIRGGEQGVSEHERST